MVFRGQLSTRKYLIYGIWSILVIGGLDENNFSRMRSMGIGRLRNK